MRLAALAFLSLSFLVSCDGYRSSSQRPSIWATWPDAQGRYRWQSVPLLSRKDPLSLESFAAQIYWRTGGSAAGFHGQVVEPHVSRSGGTWFAHDTESLLSVTALLIFERIEFFDRSLGAKDLLRWPRKIGIDINARSAHRRILNNAFYDERSDSVVITPYLGQHMPIALNLGILAHEHFHAYFSAAMKDSGFGGGFGDEKLLTSEELINLAVLLSWNEGLADFYGYMFSGDSSFVGRTFPEISIRRNLSLAISPLKTRREVQSNFKCLKSCPASALENVDPYEDGQSLARFLFIWSESLSFEQRSQLLSEILLNQKAILTKLKLSLNLSPQDWPLAFMARSKLSKSTEVCRAAQKLLENSGPVDISGCGQ